MGNDVPRLIAQLADAGLDLVHPFDARAVGERARAEATLERTDAKLLAAPTVTTNRDGSPRLLPGTPSRPLARWTRLADGPRLGLLVGNTRALWPRFVAARRTLPATNPLDTYVERSVLGALDASGIARAAVEVMFSHPRYGGVFLPFQPLAVLTGLAAPAAGGLVVHPIWGPWFAMRAVIALEPPTGTAVPALAPIAKPCTCTGACERAFEIASRDLRDWRAWLAVRDACSLRTHRYSDDQIQFHYASAWPAAADATSATRR